MPESATHAVFLSYAHEDTAAVQRIAAALRQQGIEVWFDQSELRGGEAWDQSIRQRIKDCALFVPVISSHTQARREGYFRLEWKLADERTHLMARGTAFIVPVVIDGTREAGALVPDSFLAVQWTRLPGGETTPAFVERVRNLLARDEAVRAPLPAAASAREAHTVPAAATPAAVRAGVGRALRARLSWVVGVILVASLVGGAGWGWMHRNSTEARSSEPAARRSAPPTSSPAAQPPPDFASAKSVAVLAFADLSQEKDGEYFSDGISEELLNVLAKVPGLRVAARTSAFYFKGKNLPIGEVAKQLNVGYVVEGSVRKVGSRVRITAQLINAADGFHVWSDNFDRELKDIFAVQDEIAGVIAQNLQLKLGGEHPVAKAVNPEAHRLVLEGRYFWNLRTEDGFTRAEAAFTRALEIDSQFAQAHSGLAEMCVMRALLLEGSTDVSADRVRAETEAQRALQLDPALPEPYAALGFLWNNMGKTPEAEGAFQRAFALNPNFVTAHLWHSSVHLVNGRLDLGIAEHEETARLDPLSVIAHDRLAENLAYAGRYRDAEAAIERALALRPGGVFWTRAIHAFILEKLGRRDEAIAAALSMRPLVTSRLSMSYHSLAISVLGRLGRSKDADDYAQELKSQLPADSFVHGHTRVARGDFEGALPFLGATPAVKLVLLYWDPMFDPYRDDPRFLQLMAKLGRAAEYQVARETLARMMSENQTSDGGRQRADKAGTK